LHQIASTASFFDLIGILKTPKNALRWLLQVLMGKREKAENRAHTSRGELTTSARQ